MHAGAAARVLEVCTVPPVDEQAESVRMLTSKAGGQTVASTEAARTLTLLDRLEQSILTRAFRGELVPQDSADFSQKAASAIEPVTTASHRRARATA